MCTRAMILSPNNDQGEYVGSNLNSQQSILSNRLLSELEPHGPQLMVSENSRMSVYGRLQNVTSLKIRLAV